MSEKEFKCSPVGKVQAGPDGFVLKIASKYRNALLGLDGFGHINVIWWSHYLDTPEYRNITESEQPYANGPSKLGIFATRTNLRPNPVGLTLVELVKAEGNVLTVRGLDAFDGTPVLDIKPFDSWDMAKDVRVPSWWTELEKEKAQPR